MASLHPLLTPTQLTHPRTNRGLHFLEKSLLRKSFSPEVRYVFKVFFFTELAAKINDFSGKRFRETLTIVSIFKETLNVVSTFKETLNIVSYLKRLLI